ncbi:N-acetyltransferase domain-containing protein [Favolaschia claudopus]|uniref:N-alpha-acetyltransferase 40 n=1 Tax=Favolaschia claudopus TaxID=2862362 RepID=A0AAW0EHF4_9AGAR
MSNEKDLSVGSKEVEKANKASCLKISRSLAPHPTHVFKIVLAESLTRSTRDSIWSMFEANMRTLYTASSFGWEPPKKQEELFHRYSRFILVYPKDDEGTLASFAAFRFEFEDEDDDSNILYCYDLQVSKTRQRTGLGRALVENLASIAREFKMDKIMLTVFKANKQALDFYDNVGFKMDPASPDDKDDEDYKLLSKYL